MMQTAAEVRYARINGEQSDIKILASAAIRNQVKVVYSVGKPAQITHPFQLTKYNFVEDFHKMTESNKTALLLDKWVEIRVEYASIAAPADEFPHPNVLDQLAKLGPSFASGTRNMVIVLASPASGRTSINVDTHTQTSASMLQRGTFESVITIAYPFLSKLVDKLREFSNLKRLDIVVELTAKPLDFTVVDAKLFEVTLPFYELDTFCDWKLKWIAPRTSLPQLVPMSIIWKLNSKYQTLKESDEKAFNGMVVCHKSEDAKPHTWEKN